MKMTAHRNTNVTLRGNTDDMFALFDAATNQLETDLKDPGLGVAMKERKEHQLEIWVDMLEALRF